MKKAVITSGAKQYLVTEGQTIEVERIKDVQKTVDFPALLVIDGDKITVGTPEIAKVVVSADVSEEEVKADKVTSIRYKSKKRVHKVRGHRQLHTILKITKIS